MAVEGEEFLGGVQFFYFRSWEEAWKWVWGKPPRF